MKPTAWYDPSNGVVSTDRDSPLFTPLGQVWPLFLEEQQITADCPKCEYNKSRAARWRAEAYKQGGHDVIELPWVGLTDEDCDEVERWVEFKEEGSDRIQTPKLIRYIEAKLKEKNT
jgi:hypothetical protein